MTIALVGPSMLTVRVNQWQVQVFPDGGRLSLSLGHNPIIWQDFRWKLHENERKLDQEGGRTSLAPPALDPPVWTDLNVDTTLNGLEESNTQQ